MSTIRTVVIEERLEPENIKLQEITYNKAVITGITRRDLVHFLCWLLSSSTFASALIVDPILF
jgi:hypothetical protein